MKKHSAYIIYTLLLTFVLTGCSTQKNTWLSRTYHDTTTRFNVFFNGSESYKEGIKSITKANNDDYSQVLTMYPSSHHENLSTASSNMTRSIEKSRKAIKLHSIKKKPNKNFKKWNNPKYRAWYEQNEFTPALKEVWLELAKSEFHKGDFLGSVGTFSYITRHFATVPDVVAEAQIWMARAYAEMDWIYEAEEVLTKLSTEKLNKKNTGLFSAATADILLRKKQYKEAIPYLKLAIEREKDGILRTRFQFILAQIYALTNDKKQAESYYTQVIKSSPPYQMEFNAIINRAQLLTSKSSDTEKKLNRMAKNRKNKEYLDQVYGTVGNVFLSEKDTVKAITYYTKATENSKRNGVEKGVVLIQLGDLYYEKKNYIKAEPNYNEASKIFTKEYFDYPRISKRAEVLAELVKEDKIVVLQDSLQRLAQLPEKERLDIINKIIEKVKKDEKEEQRKLEEQNNPNSSNRSNPDEDEFTMPNQIIGGNTGDWYFYNPNTIRSGKTDFRKKWGNRKLEDNWQRNNKSAALFADNTELPSESPSTSSADNQESAGNTTDKANEKQQASTVDNKSVDYYLRQLPFTEKQKEKSNEEIANALFNMGFIFKDKMEDYPVAIQTFEDFESRFPDDKRVIETIYQRFLIAAKQGDTEAEEKYRKFIISRYSGSNYAKMLSEPNFVARMTKMYQEQDSIYNRTYAAYTQSDFQTVLKNTEFVKKRYPLSALMPKFEFLNTLSVGKTQKSDVFKNCLDSLVAHYPESDVSTMAKDILALMKQGNVAQPGKTHGSLLAKRAEEAASTAEENGAATLSSDKVGKHRLMFVGNLTDSTMNKLLYSTAMFNFSRFMIKDFDFETGQINDKENAFSVTNLESFDEALWYEKTIRSDKELNRLIDSLQVRLIPISDTNYGKIKALFTLDQYIDFVNENLLKDKPTSLVAETTKPVDKPTIPEKKKEEPKVTKMEKQADTVLKEKKTESKQTVKSEPVKKPEQKLEQVTPTETPKTIEPEKPTVEEPVAWFKNTYAFRPNAPHFVALYVHSGGVANFEKIQQAFNKYNTENYGMLNLKVSLENLGKQQTIIVGSFVDANTAKSYLLRMLKEQTIIEATKGVNRRNLIGTQENLNIMVQKNDLNTYFEFMKEFYLK
ncbi:MAG: hypothetical protein QM751_09910 [Paludibacteraceae bacterium]